MDEFKVTGEDLDINETHCGGPRCVIIIIVIINYRD